MGSAPPGIELRHLRYFLAVTEELHFGRAAERLNIAQPPLSQAIRKLEEAVGVQLLQRTTRSVTPTEAGRAFAMEAQAVLAKFDRAVADARAAGGAGSVIRIACSLQFPLELMRALLEGVERRAPTIAAEVLHLGGRDQVNRLRSGALELGIFHYARKDDGIETESLFSGEPLVAFLPAGHPLTEVHELGPDDLRGETLITLPRQLNPALHEWLLDEIDRAGYTFEGIREATGADPGDAMLAVVEGRGVVLAPVRFAEAGQAGALVERRPLAVPLTMPDMVVAWRANPPAPVREALDAVRDAARSLGRAALADAADPRSPRP